MTRITTTELARRGYQYGTPRESWEALQSLSESLSNGQPVREDVALWFSTAVKKNKCCDIKALVRDLGLVERGATRRFNRFDIAGRMIELIESGLVMAEAARQCAREFGCHAETALMWYRKGVGVGNNTTEEQQMKNTNTQGMTPVTYNEVMTRINAKLADEGLHVREHPTGFSLCDESGKVHDGKVCLDSLAIDEGVLADNEFLCWPEEAIKAA